MAREVKATGFAVHAKHGNIVTALIATIEELAGGIEAKAARIVPVRPLLADICQSTVGSYGKNPDAIVQPVACVDKPAVIGNQDLGAEVAPRETGWQS